MRVLLFLTSLLAAASAVSKESPELNHQAKMTRALLRAGYSPEESNPYELLKMIQQDKYWGTGDRWRAHRNLERFAPFSRELKDKILETVLVDTFSPQPRIRSASRLVAPCMETGIEHPRTLRIYREVMHVTRDVELKRQVAGHLFRRGAESRAAADVLVGIRGGKDPDQAVLAALDLLDLGLDVEPSHAFLVKQLGDEEGLATVLHALESRKGRLPFELISAVEIAIGKMPSQMDKTGLKKLLQNLRGDAVETSVHLLGTVGCLASALKGHQPVND
jgi:hypothetical protein